MAIREIKIDQGYINGRAGDDRPCPGQASGLRGHADIFLALKHEGERPAERGVVVNEQHVNHGWISSTKRKQAPSPGAEVTVNVPPCSFTTRRER